MFNRYLPRLHKGALLKSGLIACSALGLGTPVIADDQDGSPGSSGAAIADLGGSGNVVIDGGNSVGTVTSSNLRGAASLQESLGRRAYFESLSAINLQKAIDANLYNRRQSLQAYYEMRELRDEAVRNRDRITHEDAVRLAKQKAPDRLTSQDYDPYTGKIFWPRPLDSEVLLPYTQIIDQSFAKRSGSDRAYTAADARRVERMVSLIQEAVDAVKKELPVKEYIALSDYLASIDYEASHDLEGNRIDR